MKKLHPILITLVVAAFVFTGLTSCIKDDMDDCPETQLLVKFVPEMYELPENEHRIDSVHVYVFDRNDRFVTAWNGGGYDYLSGTGYVVPVDLEPGEYRFVAWTNPCDSYLFNRSLPECLPQTTTLRDLELYLDCSADRTFTSDIPDLHYGVYTGAVVEGGRNQTYIIYLVPNTYRINTTVKGLPVSGDEYRFSVRENNSRFTFGNAIVSGQDDFQHIRTSRFGQDNRLSASMRLLSLTDDHCLPEHRLPKTRAASDRSPQFAFSNTTTGRVYYSGDLVRMIRKAYESAGQTVDFDVTYVFDIELAFDAMMNVTITVNGWTYKYNPTEL